MRMGSLLSPSRKLMKSNHVKYKLSNYEEDKS
jgi:hypothetical protein